MHRRTASTLDHPQTSTHSLSRSKPYSADGWIGASHDMGQTH
jgi:hypothetical protein